MRSSRQESWSGSPPPGDLSNSEVEPRSPALQAEPPGKPVALNMGVQICIPVSAFTSFGYTPRSKLALQVNLHMAILFSFSVFHNSYTILIPTSNAQEFQFLHIPASTAIFWFGDDGCSNECKVVACCGLICL